MSQANEPTLRAMEAEEGEFSEARTTAATRPLPWALGFAIAALAGLVTLTGVGYQELGGYKARLEQQLREGQELKGLLFESNKQLQQLEGIQKDLEQQLKAQTQNTETLQQRLQQEQQNYQQGRGEMLEALSGLHRRIGRSTSRWMAAEAEYLIRVANHRLQLEGDVATAKSALKAADERLRDSADPIWGPVREVLAQDIAKVDGLGQVDYQGLSARLGGLASQAGQLEIKGQLINNPMPVEPEQKKRKFKLKKMLKDGWEGFSSLVVLRRHDKPLNAMLPPEHAFFLHQNLRLQLESARLALLRRDQKLFDESLTQASQWLTDFFEPEHPQTQAMQATLKELTDTQVRIAIPDISDALVALKQQLELSREQVRTSGDNREERP
jgi:uroporphyrin-3 C-methyltransferase